MKISSLNVLSVFDGMSCGRVALDRAGVRVHKYYASEVDKHATKISEKNYPDIIRLGDVNGWGEWSIPWLDLIIGGSPCQGFSNAGKGLNFSDPRSKLFFVFVDIVNRWQKINPDLYFMLENVSMREDWEGIISRYMGIAPIKIDSALVSAQHRERLYWTNIAAKKDMFGFSLPGIEQPEDKGILLKDIIEPGEWPEADFTEGQKEYFKKRGEYRVQKNHVQIEGEKSKTLTATMDEKWNFQLVEKKQKTSDNGLILAGMADDLLGKDQIRRIYSPEGKGPALETMGGGNREPKIMIVREATKKGYTEIQPDEGVDLRFLNSKTRNGRRMEKKSNALTSSADHNIGWYNGINYRKLLPLECERLQTLPDNYTEGVSNSQRYKMCGNGWTVDVIAHIFRYLPDNFHSLTRPAYHKVK